MTKVLIVEDDEIIGEELTEVFVQWGFDATAVLTVESFWSKIEEFQQLTNDNKFLCAPCKNKKLRSNVRQKS